MSLPWVQFGLKEAGSVLAGCAHCFERLANDFRNEYCQVPGVNRAKLEREMDGRMHLSRRRARAALNPRPAPLLAVLVVSSCSFWGPDWHCHPVQAVGERTWHRGNSAASKAAPAHAASTAALPPWQACRQALHLSQPLTRLVAYASKTLQITHRSFPMHLHRLCAARIGLGGFRRPGGESAPNACPCDRF